VQTQNGQWFMVYLCGRKIGDGYSMLGRETALDPITWTEDGWPLVNNLNGPSSLQIKPDLPECIFDNEYDDDFGNSYLSTNWCFPRVPEMDGIALAHSYVKIKGSVEDLTNVKAKNVLLRRQEHFRFNVQAKLKMPTLYPGQDCGLTCYYDENTFLKYGLFATEEAKLLLKVVEYIGDDVVEHEAVEIDARERFITLRIETNYLVRGFSYSYDEKTFERTAILDNVYYLCDEGLKKGKRFTGAMVGMYAYAGCEYSRNYAEFDYFNYEPIE